MSTKVYLLHHSRIGDDDEAESLKLIGVFATEQEANDAIGIVKDKRGFNEYPDGFEISCAVLGKIGWQDGFLGTISDEEWENWGNDNNP